MIPLTNFLTSGAFANAAAGMPTAGAIFGHHFLSAVALLAGMVAFSSLAITRALIHFVIDR